MTSGIIGLGNMGGRIARRIRDEGLPVLGYDLDPEQAEMAGIELADSVAEVAARSGVVLLSLPDSTAVEQVVLGDDGLLANARARQVVVDLTTAAPSSSVKIHAALWPGARWPSSTPESRAAPRQPSRERSRSWRAERGRRWRSSRRSSRRSAPASTTWASPARVTSRSC